MSNDVVEARVIAYDDVSDDAADAPAPRHAPPPRDRTDDASAAEASGGGVGVAAREEKRDLAARRVARLVVVLGWRGRRSAVWRRVVSHGTRRRVRVGWRGRRDGRARSQPPPR